MGKDARAKSVCHPIEYICPRCKKCFKCEHKQIGELPEKYWLCPDGVAIWVNSDRSYKNAPDLCLRNSSPLVEEQIRILQELQDT